MQLAPTILGKQFQLICSKSRVTPMKVLESSPELFEEITMPRLELNAALLLTQLTQIVKKAYGDKIQEIHLWSDSIITLCWIATPPGKLRTYESNRVKKIQDMMEKAIWHYVSTRDNSADLYREVQRLRNY